MSHFIVGVIVKELEDLEKALAPYQENNMGDCPEEFLEFFDREDDIGEEYATSEEAKNYGSLEEFAEGFYGYGEVDEKTGRYGYWENPNAKWDWYMVGGRWHSQLIVDSKVEDFITGSRSWASNDDAPSIVGFRHVDGARIKDIRFDEMEKESKKMWEESWKKYKKGLKEGKLPKESLDFIHDVPPNITTKKDYLASKNFSFSIYAVITADGVWHGCGEMGWFAMSFESEDEKEIWEKTYMDRFIKSANPDHYLIIVDCHI